MVDRLFAEPSLAELYDTFCNPRPDFAFYLPLVMCVNSVLDVGCGTGELLRLAREAGHAGRLVGVDPADAMLDQARVRDDIEWIRAHFARVQFEGQFDLVVMTGHAFQVLLDDDEIADFFGAAARVLTDDGVLVFETRNPEVRAWEHWRAEYGREIIGPHGDTVRLETNVDHVEGEFVSFTHTFTSASWAHPQVSDSTLRFVDAQTLNASLRRAGFAIHEQFGDWDRSPFTERSPEIITLAHSATDPVA